VSDKFEAIKEYVIENNSQSHLCICNTHLFTDSVNNGVYGFPHQGTSQTKSFWRAVASMYNISPHDLIFIYRTNGDVPGCKEIHGPFKVASTDGLPVIYYELDSNHYPMKIQDQTDCKVRFLFQNLFNKLVSLPDNFELIKKFESKEIWGYRHPSVMNIGAARKKSVTSFTNKQTLLLLDLLEKLGTTRAEINHNIPLDKHLLHYDSLKGKSAYKLDDTFLISSYTHDEAFLYAYILRGLKVASSTISKYLMQDFTEINSNLLDIPFGKISTNAMLEAIISPHLQDELDIVLMNKDDSRMLFLEIKSGSIDQLAINQTIKYIDLLAAIFPERKVYANIIGQDKDITAIIPDSFKDKILMVKYIKTKEGFIRFEKI
jgi:hypothetical protein